MSRGRWGIFLWLVFAMGNRAFADRIAVPCNAGASPSSLRPCSEVLRVGDTREMDSQLETHFRNQVNALYRGVVLDVIQTQSEREPQGNHFGTPVCNPIPGIFNENQEEGIPPRNTNHRNDSCGEFVRFEINVPSGLGRIFPWFGTTTVTVHASAPYAKREEGFIRGAWVQALTCFQAQVRREIQNRSLEISPTCDVLRGAVAHLGANHREVEQALVRQLAGSTNIADICRGQTPIPWVSGDVGPLRQSAQQLCAARTYIEGAFKQLAICEVFARAGNDYRNHFPSLNEFVNQARDSIGNRCRSECSSQCKPGCAFRGDCSSCATNCANRCYQRDLPGFVRNKLRQWTPAGGCPNA